MSADQLLQYVTQGLYFVVFIVAAIRAARSPLRANVDTALLFGATALIITQDWLSEALDLSLPPIYDSLSLILLMSLPYLLLRLVDDFAGVRPLLMRVAALGWILATVGLLLVPRPLPLWLVLPLVVYFFGIEIYAAVRFIREARYSSGVTRRRMQAVAMGSIFLGLLILTAGVRMALPALAPLSLILVRALGLASGIAYFLGFAPPAWLRRSWQGPEIRAFLAEAASLPRLPHTDAIVQALERGAAESVGAPHASIGLWDDAEQKLRFSYRGEPYYLVPGQMIAGRAFQQQRAIFSPDAPREDPDNAEMYRAYGSTAVLAAPITAGEKRLGVLVAYAPRPSIFAEDDLQLLVLLADQAAVILESRALIDEATRVRAREEATRLKEDFLSAAAHDLKTPLTTLVAQAQLMERRAQLQPDAPPDLRGIQRLVAEARRLNELVLELLDASRAEQGRLVGEREKVDLVELARSACERQGSDKHRCLLDVDESVVGEYDRTRIMQLFDNLIENAIKYSPQGGDIRVSVRETNGEAHLAVADNGIGIAREDLTHVFDRFHRGGNVDDRRFAGMGLGLFICRAIAEQHGGRIWAESPGLGRGAAIHVVLPLAAPVANELGGVA